MRVKNVKKCSSKFYKAKKGFGLSNRPKPHTSFTIINNKEKHQIFTFQGLEPAKVWDFCLKNFCNYPAMIQNVGSSFYFSQQKSKPVSSKTGNTKVNHLNPRNLISKALALSQVIRPIPGVCRVSLTGTPHNKLYRYHAFPSCLGPHSDSDPSFFLASIPNQSLVSSAYQTLISGAATSIIDSHRFYHALKI